MRRVILLGTGTDVGKTYVGTRLARLYQRHGGSCLGLKPIESGLAANSSSDGPPHSSGPPKGDAGALLAAAERGAPPLYSFKDPISAHLAARRVNREIEIEDVISYVEQRERDFLEEQSVKVTALSQLGPTTLPPLCLIETAGGAFSPISEQHNNWDLTRALNPNLLILVAPDSLGVLHDVHATLRALSPFIPHLLVISDARPRDASTGTNVEEIQRVVLPQLGLDEKLACVACPRWSEFNKEMIPLFAGMAAL